MWCHSGAWCGKCAGGKRRELPDVIKRLSSLKILPNDCERRRREAPHALHRQQSAQLIGGKTAKLRKTSARRPLRWNRLLTIKYNIFAIRTKPYSKLDSRWDGLWFYLNIDWTLLRGLVIVVVFTTPHLYKIIFQFSFPPFSLLPVCVCCFFARSVVYGCVMLCFFFSSAWRAQKMLMWPHSGEEVEMFSISFIWIFWYSSFMSPVYVCEFFYRTSTYFWIGCFDFTSLSRCLHVLFSKPGFFSLL